MAEAPSYQLPRLPYLRLRCTLRAGAPAQLPAFKGSTLRGAFGHALRQIACTMGPAQPCATCRRRACCVYTRLFETFVEGEPPPFLRGIPSAPRPYLFEPRDDRLDFAAGDLLDFDLLLFGAAVDLAPFAVLALERMAEQGLGARRAPFALEEVRYLDSEGRWQTVAHGSASSWRAPQGPSADPPHDLPAGELVLRFLTPTRLLVDGRLAERVEFRALAFKMLRRVLELAWFHVPGAAIDWTFRPLLQQASRVQVVSSNLEWRDWQRYSHRQGRAMTLGGFVGEMRLAGDLAPFAALLRTAEIIHVGKGATFGLGRVEVEAAE